MDYWLLAVRVALNDLGFFSQFGNQLFHAVYPDPRLSRLGGFDFLSF